MFTIEKGFYHSARFVICEKTTDIGPEKKKASILKILGLNELLFLEKLQL